MSVLKDLTAISTDPALTDLVYAVLDPSGTPADRKVAFKYLFGKMLAPVCDGRLTLESGVAVSTTDQTAKTTVYFTPYLGARVAVYDGTRWVLHTFTELSLALGTLIDATNYDVFLYDNAGTLTLTLGPAWASATARGTGAGTTELTTQDGVYVNAVSITSGPGAKAGRYLGTIRTTATTTTEDSAAKRFVWNAQQRIARPMKVAETTNSWEVTADTWQQVNVATSNQLAIVAGLAGDAIDVRAGLLMEVDAFNSAATAIGVDSTSSPHADCGIQSVPGGSSVAVGGAWAHLRTVVSLGYHYYAWLQYNSGSSAMTAWGDTDGGGNLQRAMITGLWWC